MQRFIEVDVKNKKHTECCDVLGTAIVEMEKYQDTLESLKKNEISDDANSQIDEKITDLRFKKVVLRDKAKRCGCREPVYQPKK